MKVYCDVLYTTVLPVWEKECGTVNLNLGIFETKRDASIAGNLIARILYRDASDFNIMAIEDFNVKEIYVPEAQLEEVMSSSEYHRDLEEFISRCPYAVWHNKKKGFTELHKTLNQVADEYDKDIERQKKKDTEQKKTQLGDFEE